MDFFELFAPAGFPSRGHGFHLCPRSLLGGQHEAVSAAKAKAAAFTTKNQSSSCSSRLQGFIGAGSDPIKGSGGLWSSPLPSPRPWGGEGTHHLARLTTGTPSRHHPGPELAWGWGGLDVAPLPRVTPAASRTPGWGQGCPNPQNCHGTTQSSRHPLSLGRSLLLEAACRNLPSFS